MSQSLIHRMATSSSSPTVMKKEEYVNWTELPPELMSSTLHRLGAIEILETAQKVCRTWRRLCNDPSMWREIVVHGVGDFGDRYYEKLCRHVVSRSRGGLVEIDISHFGSDSLFRYIADQSSGRLRSLRIAFCYQVTNKGFIAAIARLPLLEELEVSYCSFSEEFLRVVGQSCPNLKTLKKNCTGYRRPRRECNDVALAIAETMTPGLRHLQLFGDRLTNAGLNAILNRCPNLEHLDLRQCFNVKLVGDLERRCFERIKVVRRPNDSVHDYSFDATVNDFPYGRPYNYVSDGSDNSDFDPDDY